MSIFLIIAKEMLKVGLEKGLTASALADNSYTNLAVTFFNPFVRPVTGRDCGRDPDIATKKCSSLYDCALEILGVSDAGTDNEIAQVLQGILQKYEDKARDLKEVGFFDSNTGEALLTCFNHLRILKNDLQKAGLLDLSEKESPFNQFGLEMGRFIWHVVINSDELHVAQKNMVLKELELCRLQLIELDPKKASKKVEETIQHIRQENAKLCKKADVFKGNYSAVAGVLTSDDNSGTLKALGELEKCCFSALQALHSPALSLQASPKLLEEETEVVRPT